MIFYAIHITTICHKIPWVKPIVASFFWWDLHFCSKTERWLYFSKEEAQAGIPRSFSRIFNVCDRLSWDRAQGAGCWSFLSLKKSLEPILWIDVHRTRSLLPPLIAKPQRRGSMPSFLTRSSPSLACPSNSLSCEKIRMFVVLLRSGLIVLSVALSSQGQESSRM